MVLETRGLVQEVKLRGIFNFDPVVYVCSDFPGLYSRFKTTLKTTWFANRDQN
jgi:hypothetical protein